MSIVMTVPAARSTLVISALAVSGGVDGRMKDRRRIEDVRVAGQGKVVRDVERGRDRVVRRAPVPAWRSRFPCPGLAAHRPDRRNRRAGCRRRRRRRSCPFPPWPVSTLAAPLPVSWSLKPRTGEIFDGDIGSPPDLPPARVSADAARRVGVVCRVAAGAAVQFVGAAAAGQRVVARAAGELRWPGHCR